MLNETNLNCFLSLAETLSFTESARRLYLTQQAVSKNIMQLEQDAGFPLVDRSFRTIALTVEGIRYRDMLLHLREIYRSETELIRMEFNSAHKTIRIGCQNFLDLGAGIIRAVESMTKSNSELSLLVNRFSPGELVDRLYDGSLDVIIVYQRYSPENSDYKITELFKSTLLLLVSGQHPLAKEDATYLDFRQEPYIMDVFHNETAHAIEERSRREAALCQIEPSSVITAPNRESAYTMAELNYGMLLGSDISQVPPGIRLMRYRTDAVDGICCVCRKNVGPLVDEFIATLKCAYTPRM